MSWVFVDVEAGPAPGSGHLYEFGAVHYHSRQTFHGHDATRETFAAFDLWLQQVCGRVRPVFVSDNPAFDWQWINFYFHKHLGANPFGHSARRISDFYAGLVGDFSKTQEWKRWRRTPHDHNPVHDAMGNVEAFSTMLQVRARHEDELLLQLAASFSCERASETWRDCPTETHDDQEYADVVWCRSCTAGAVLQEQEGAFV